MHTTIIYLKLYLFTFRFALTILRPFPFFKVTLISVDLLPFDLDLALLTTCKGNGFYLPQCNQNSQCKYCLVEFCTNGNCPKYFKTDLYLLSFYINKHIASVANKQVSFAAWLKGDKCVFNII